MRRLANIYRLGRKELVSLRFDIVISVLVIYSFSAAVFLSATDRGFEIRNASVGIVDEDRSQLSARLADALLPPYFLPPQPLALDAIDRAMDNGRFTFVIDFPPDFQADVMAGRRPVVQVNVDATAMSQALNGAGYIQAIMEREIAVFLQDRGDQPAVTAAIRVLFNPNLNPVWFGGVMELTSQITVLAIVLTGAALIREREHGTIDHLLVMPITPLEIVLAKVWANGLVIVVAATLSLLLVIRGLLGVPIAGSIPLFVVAVVLYLFSLTAIGILLGTVARTMPQLGLLFIPVVIPMIMLSGSFTPLDSMPAVIQHLMALSPSTHFVEAATAILFRGAGIDVVWRPFVAVTAIGLVFLAIALARFRRTITL